MLIPRGTVVILSFCFILSTTAWVDYSHNYSISSAPRPPTPQFHSFYPKHGKGLARLTRTKCNGSYADYMFAYHSPRGSPNASHLLTTCYGLEACLLHAVPADYQANFNSAAIILGLMPTLLASIGPSFAETSLLSAHRPFLSFLISMGAVGIWPNRIFEYVHPPDILRRRSGSPRIGKMRPWPAAMTSLSQYIVAICAIVNVMTTSIEIGSKSILAFGCTTTFAPLLWSILSSVIHLVSVLSYFITRKVVLRRRSADRLSQQAHNSKTQADLEQSRSGITRAATSPTTQQRLYQVWLSCRDACLREVTICGNHPISHDIKAEEVPRISILLAVGAGLMNFCHVTFGIIIFSSLIFISVEDVFKRVLWRYIVSSTACRLLLILELSGL